MERKGKHSYTCLRGLKHKNRCLQPNQTRGKRQSRDKAKEITPSWAASCKLNNVLCALHARQKQSQAKRQHPELQHPFKSP
eukprot:1161820-Pelagomonas_calceolata.AAC.5